MSDTRKNYFLRENSESYGIEIVKEAVENGEIAYERYESYLGMLEEEGKYR